MTSPYWERFCTPLAQRILALIGGQRAEQQPGVTSDEPYILEEKIDAVLGDGRYQIGGDVLATKGKAALTVGQTVHVFWRKGRRERILTHQWQRAQGGGWRVTGGPIVEELWLAGNDVWFRNGDKAASLNLGRFGLAGNLGQVGWGARSDRFFVQHTTSVFVPGSGVIFTQYISVFKFARDPDAPLATGTEPAGAIALERTHALAGDPFVVAHLAPSGFPVARDLKVSDVGHASQNFGSSSSTCSIGIDAIALSDAGHIIVAFSCQANLLCNSAIVPGSDPPTTFSTTFALAYPVVVDLDTHTKLLDAFADGAAAWGSEAGDLIFSVFPFQGFPIVNEFDIPFPGTYVTYPENDQMQQFTLSEPLVVEGRLIAFVGVSRRERQRTSYSVADGYPITYTPRHRTLVAQPPSQASGADAPSLLVLVPGTDLYPNDFRFDVNETHLLWHRVEGADDAAHWHAHLTSFGLGTTSDAGASQARFFDRNVRLLAPSFAWQPAAAPVAQPEAERDRFLALWDFDSGAALVPPTGSDVTEDRQLIEAKAMAPLPADAPTQPTDRGALDVHVVNSEPALSSVGRYRPHAG